MSTDDLTPDRERRSTMTNRWFRWFAWHPVWTTDRGWRWLCVAWRRHTPPPPVQGADWYFEHRVELD